MVRDILWIAVRQILWEKFLQCAFVIGAVFLVYGMIYESIEFFK